jgi:anthranilate synthase component 1
MQTTRTEISADLITPLGAYLRLRSGEPSFLLESVEQGRLGRYSLLGSGSSLVSFEQAEREVAAGRTVVGYLGYDFIAKVEPTVPLPDERPAVPESNFILVDTLVRFDHVTGTADVLAGDADAIAARLSGSLPAAEPAPHPASPTTRRFPSQQEHEDRVRRAKEYIRAGDAFQIVLAQRAERATAASAVGLYRALRRINPSPYLFLLELGAFSLVGSSPETHVKLEGTRASLNPIAGTIRAGEGDAERLLASEKDRAEHVMLVDLGRNDLSRVCRAGTVRVERFLEAERYSHVTHLVSEVVGELLPEHTAFDLLRATFPAGTVSGAPKIRAMQIITELERHGRGVYAGVVGYALPNGDMDTCITIRTILLKDGDAYLQAGGGIVADSDPTEEHHECLNKLAALEAAIDLAEDAP